MPNFFQLKKRTKRVLVQKIFQEKPKILSRNPRKTKNLVKKSKNIHHFLRRQNALTANYHSVLQTFGQHSEYLQRF